MAVFHGMALLSIGCAECILFKVDGVVGCMYTYLYIYVMSLLNSLAQNIQDALYLLADW